MLNVSDDFSVQEYPTGTEKNSIINSLIKDNSGNPFYLIDLGEVYRKYIQWCELLPMVKPYFALKSNSDVAILRLLVHLGVDFDCASKNEILLVNQWKKDNEIIFANPCKDPSHLEFAREAMVDLMTFDCKEELYKIKQYHPFAKLVLRIKTDDSKSLCQFNCKFGADLDEVKDLLETAMKLELNTVGLSFHVGSGCGSAEPFGSAIRDARKVFTIASSLGITMT